MMPDKVEGKISIKTEITMKVCLKMIKNKEKEDILMQQNPI